MKSPWKYQLKWILNFARPYRRVLWGYLLLELTAVASGLLFVWWSKKAIDYAMAQDLADARTVIIYFVIAAIIGLLCTRYSVWINQRVQTQMLIQLQKQVLRAQMDARWDVTKHWHTGDMMIRINTDCREVVQVIAYTSISTLVTLIRLLGAAALLYWLDPMLALLIMAVSPLIVLSKGYFKRMRKLNLAVKQAESTLGNVVQENLRFRLSIRALNLHTIRWKKVNESQDQIYLIKMALLKYATRSQFIMKAAVQIGVITAFIWGVYRLQAGEITFGTLSAFLQLVSRIQGPVIALMGAAPLFIRFHTSMDRLQEIFLEDKESIPPDDRLEDIEKLSLQDVCFSYDDNLVIDGLNAAFEKGKPTAIIGASGKGKTTLMRLLLALFPPTQGEINLFCNGQRHALSARHRSNFAYVPQGEQLFTATIRENLQVNGNVFTDQELHTALTTACATFVYDLPQGLDTKLGESGYGLSEGQAQRIAIARALLRGCRIWLFDEITSALDPDTAVELTQRLLKAGESHILIFVTHDMQLASACDQQVYLK